MAQTLTVIFYLITLVISYPNIPQNEPKYFEAIESWDAIESTEYILSFPSTTTNAEFDLYLLRDNDSRPIFFYSDINTPVCIDNICKPAYIELYWNLVGEYIGYGLYPEKPLTKYDHELCHDDDYHKLHNLLKNKHSLLNRKSLDDLYDLRQGRQDTIEFDGKRVDAITGATKKEIKEYIIEGALYSCYVIWQIVHGPGRDSIINYINQEFERDEWLQFIYSDNSAYQYKGVQNLDTSYLVEHRLRIVDILPKLKPVARTFLLKKLPDAFWQNENHIQKLYRHINGFDIHSNTILIEKMEIASPISLLETSKNISSLTKNQLQIYLRYIDSESHYYDEILQHLKENLKQEDFPNRYIITAFLAKE